MAITRVSHCDSGYLSVWRTKNTFLCHKTDFTQRSISPTGMAPDTRAISLPSLKIAMVGMLRMLCGAAVWGWASVSSLHNCAVSFKRSAASAKAGAIIWQGPHQGAQKSTTTGNWLRSTWRLKLSLSKLTGLPVIKASWQWPQTGLPANFNIGTRLVEWQWTDPSISETVYLESCHFGWLFQLAIIRL